MTVSSRAVFIAGSACMIACALVTDLGDLGGSDGGVDAATCDASGACVALALPPAWTPVAYHEGFVGCPDGFVSQKFVTAPTATCTCGCTDTLPTCDDGHALTFLGTTDCTTSGAAILYDGGCTQISGSFGAFFAADPIAPSNGACTAITNVDASTTSAEACVPACSDAVCQGIVPLGFKACVIALGDLPCPAGTPFTAQTKVGTSVDATCTGCTCTHQDSCNQPTIEFFSDSTCGSSLAKFAADGTCVASAENGKMVASTKYTAVAAGSCDAGGAAKPDAALVGVHTVCCAP